MKDVTEQTVWFEDLGRGDVARVGGKNAALGEMIRSLAAAGVSVPPGFATTAAAYRRFIEVNHLEQELRDALGELRDGKASLAEAGPVRVLALDQQQMAGRILAQYVRQRGVELGMELEQGLRAGVEMGRRGQAR